MKRLAFLLSAFLALGLGTIGAFVPLLPTVPFVILAAYCFARSSPALEQRLTEHPIFGSHIRSWRERGAISRKGKRAAGLAFLVSAAAGLAVMDFPLVLVALGAIAIGTGWVLSRPTD